MTIRIPPKADIETRNAFLDVEERLKALEAQKIQRKSETPTEEIVEEDPDLQVDGDLIVENDIRIEGSVDAPHLYEGLIKVVPAGEAGTSIAQRTINLASSLAIAPGGLSADSVRARMIDATGVLGPTGTDIGAPVGGNVWCYIRRAATLAVPATTSTHITWDTSYEQHGGDWWSSGTNITPPVPGLYLIIYSAYIQTGTSGTRQVRIAVNGALLDGRHGYSQITTSAQITQVVSALHEFNGTSDYVSGNLFLSHAIDCLDASMQLCRVGDHP
jgi:hypothetical protein